MSVDITRATYNCLLLPQCSYAYELVANSIHTADATPTQLNSTVESRRRRRCVLGIRLSKMAKKQIAIRALERTIKYS